MNAVRVKVCGITRAQDAHAAVKLGVEVLGFNFWPKSKRYVPPAQAAKIVATLPPFVTTVGVFVNQSRAHILRAARESGVRVVQLHGDESPAFCARFPWPVIKALPVRDEDWWKKARMYRVSALLLDAPTAGYGGSGQTFDWNLLKKAASLKVPFLLAGGLTEHNVARAIRRVSPYAVDVASGVERSPGKKDVGKMTRFVASVRKAHAL